MSIRHYFHTLRYLKLSQIYWRIYYRLFPKTNVYLSEAPPLRKTVGAWVKPIEKTIKMIDKRHFNFLNEKHELKQKKDWNKPNLAKLWLYNLHYFDDLNCVEANKRKEWHLSLIKSWIDENPIGHGNGWEPYTISLRIVNWIKWCFAGNELEQSIKSSLVIQSRYLMKRLEFHLLGNHLVANAKALIYAGLFFEGNEADSWFKTGIKILSEQSTEQVLQDGGNFELSPMYHAIFLEDLLDIINVCNHYKVSIFNKIADATALMMEWLDAMTHPNGELSFFNDSANNISASTVALENYYKKFSLRGTGKKRNNIYLKQSGYYCIRRENLVAMLDLAAVGPDYIPGHAHADSLSFECSIFNKKVIVNSGTSLYGTSAERLRQRGTKAHSTLMINNENSSEVWGGFRVARRARILNTEIKHKKDDVIIAACHDGYHRLPGKPTHHREWKFHEKNISITDTVTGKNRQEIEVLYHLGPDVAIKEQENNNIVLLVNGNIVTMTFENSGELSIEPSTYHPEFGLSIENKKIVWKHNFCKMPFNCKMNLSW